MSVAGHGGHRRAAAVAASLLLTVAALAGCQQGDAGASRAAPVAGESAAGESAAVTPRASTAQVSVSPAADSVDVAPDAAVSVTVAKGTLKDVSVLGPKGTKLAGTVSADRRSWTLDRPLTLDAIYVVSASAVDADGVATSTVSSFRTLAPSALLRTSISPLSGSTVGVGMPIIVKLNHAVKDRAAVQRALEVTTSNGVAGVWSWQGDSQLQFRPETFWPAHTDVTLKVGLTGVDAGGGVWGDETRTVAFSTAAAMVSTVDVKRKVMTVTRDAKVLRTVPITAGKDGFLTRGGIKVISEKHRTKLMDAATGGTSKNSPEYYRLTVQYALRVTWSGEFLHAAPWSVGSQGAANVSHGCVGMSMADGKWFYEQSRVGDVVKVVGSPRRIEPGNGWTAWNVPWSEWKAGSAV